MSRNLKLNYKFLKTKLSVNKLLMITYRNHYQKQRMTQ